MTDTDTTADGHVAPTADGATRRRPWLVALAAGVACAVCLVPGLVLGGALAGIGAAVAGWRWVAAVAAVVTVGLVLIGRGADGHAATCGCDDC